MSESDVGPGRSADEEGASEDGSSTRLAGGPISRQLGLASILVFGALALGGRRILRADRAFLEHLAHGRR
jgi:hypothetical protein